MSSEPDLIEQTVERLSLELGPVDLDCEPYPFNHSDYYRVEMGAALIKKLVSFRDLRQSFFLAPFKRRTSACELLHRGPGGGRLVNVDPGYWSDAKLVLASTKNYSHRIEIGRRVFAEVTLMVQKKVLTPLPWTYPDYRSSLVINFFSQVRNRYLEQIANYYNLKR